MMKRSLVVLALFLGSLSQGALHQINPFNVTEQCLSYSGQRVTDHRVTPPRTYYRYSAAVSPCSAVGPNKRMNILWVDGRPWTGIDGNVQIRNSMNLCLTNPANYSIQGTDTGELRWEACSTPNGLIAMRQQWYLTRNQYGATRIASHLQFVMNKPNPQLECMERVNPTLVRRRPCTTLGNWQVRQSN